METRIKKIVKIQHIDDFTKNSAKNDLLFWLSKSPEERIAAVEFLRKQYYGSTPRLQRVARVIQRKSG